MSRAPLSPEFLQGLHEAQETYRHLVEGIPAILYIDAVDDLSTNIYTSPQVLDLLGFTVEQWRDEPNLWLARLHEDDRERVVAAHHESNASGGPFHCDYRLIAADGRELWFRDDAVLVRDAAGQPLFWRGVMLDITDQKRAEGKLRHSLDILRRTMEERRMLVARLEEAQEQERRRIAADIHDDSIQVISAADMRAQALARQIEDPVLHAEARELHDTLREAVERLRHLLFELRPPVLDREGLAAALRQYLEQPSGAPELEVALDVDLATEPPDDVRATLFRIAQEAITNVRKHAGARHLEVRLSSGEDGILLRVSDDGRGIEDLDLTSPEPGHLGLPAMVERAELAGGWCRIEGTRGRGTTVECWLPLEPSDGIAEAER
ncbi:MAG: PAS domain-containing protein [Solirubrobacterales bacterium]